MAGNAKEGLDHPVPRVVVKEEEVGGPACPYRRRHRIPSRIEDTVPEGSPLTLELVVSRAVLAAEIHDGPSGPRPDNAIFVAI